MWSKVDLPTPEVPAIDRHSPLSIEKSIPRNTSIVPSPVWNDLRRPRTRTSGSLISERFGRVEPRGLPARKQGRSEGGNHGNPHGNGDLAEVELRRKRVELVNAGRERVDPNHRFDLALNPGDLVIVNQSRVLPAYLQGVRRETGGKVSGLFLGQDVSHRWQLMIESRGKLIAGEFIDLDDKTQLRLIERDDSGAWLADLESEQDTLAVLENGQVLIRGNCDCERLRIGNNRRRGKPSWTLSCA